jgi:hypothetical protein
MSDETKLSDSILDGREREKRFRAESLQRQAEQQQREQLQRDRQARHEAEARKIDEQTRAQLFMRVMQAQETKPQAEEPPIPLSTARQDEQLALEQEAGRRALARHAQRNAPAAVAQDRTDAGEKAKETGIPGGSRRPETNSLKDIVTKKKVQGPSNNFEVFRSKVFLAPL